MNPASQLYTLTTVPKGMAGAASAVGNTPTTITYELSGGNGLQNEVGNEIEVVGPPSGEDRRVGRETGGNATKRPDVEREAEGADQNRDEGHGQGAARGVVQAHREQQQADRAVEVVILIGVPGSGKTKFFRDRYATTHEHISKDLFPRHARQRGDRQAILLSSALKAGRPVVVDNTNVSREERAEAITVARAAGARIIGYYFDTPIRMCVARNARREGRARVPNVAIFAAARRFEMPTLGEGFDDLYRVVPREDGIVVERLA